MSDSMMPSEGDKKSATAGYDLGDHLCCASGWFHEVQIEVANIGHEIMAAYERHDWEARGYSGLAEYCDLRFSLKIEDPLTSPLHILRTFPEGITAHLRTSSYLIEPYIKALHEFRLYLESLPARSATEDQTESEEEPF
jgi:hypothetical protein